MFFSRGPRIADIIVRQRLTLSRGYRRHYIINRGFRYKPLISFSLRPSPPAGAADHLHHVVKSLAARYLLLRYSQTPNEAS